MPEIESIKMSMPDSGQSIENENLDNSAIINGQKVSTEDRYLSGSSWSEWPHKKDEHPLFFEHEKVFAEKMGIDGVDAEIIFPLLQVMINGYESGSVDLSRKSPEYIEKNLIKA